MTISREILIAFGHPLTGLSVREDAGVVTLKRIVQDIATQGIEDDLLAREVLHPGLQGVKAVIEREGLRFVPATNTAV